MTLYEIWYFLLNSIVQSGFILAVCYFMRDSIGRYFTKKIEYSFDKKMESFKSGVRDNEKELEQIRSFLASAQKSRHSAFQAKRFEAAETLMRATKAISGLTLAVEYMKILKIDDILKTNNDNDILNLFDSLSKTVDIENIMISIKSIDTSISELYLDEKTMKLFDAYRGICTTAAMMIKILAIPLESKAEIFKINSLSKSVIELFPNSKENFDKFGETYSYYLASYIHDEVLQALRKEVSGVDHVHKDADFAERLAIDSRMAQANVLASLKKVGLPNSLIVLDAP